MKPTLSLIRKKFLKVLRKFEGKDVTIKHHWTDDKIKLNIFRHRNYWFHGKNREKNVMHFLDNLINAGDCVVDIGGHVGYLTLYFRKLVGDSGSVYVFEPAPNNLPYIQHNVLDKKNVKLFEVGVGEVSQEMTMYTESLSGMNNSMIKDFNLLGFNSEYSGIEADLLKVAVQVVKLDEFLSKDLKVDFIKIDVEGLEYEALVGMKGIINNSRPKFMVELNGINNKKVFDLLSSYDYVPYGENKNKLIKVEDWEILNTFWVHKEVSHESVSK